ncbi:GAF and ANTAR domain-containing protein [Streptomyces sp. SLBN-31]|jgi:transcriptional regulator with GAF, ATPase, and Fis domain|uniref:GAF and ANTAR domain-containing protein n=1 Tax=Streptomyces sp. SLBN-31 TaxID=2768444 RepID=UPI001150C2D8|nr:GAF and ANTAR domain-containing protein [Streptomyces sp. SLBN-31]TQJ85375.1 GAF domain-containing protein [Streptomyces sp. SLBN-31]
MKAVRLIAEASVGAPVEEVPQRVCAAVREGLEVDGVTVSLLTDTPARQLLAASDDAALLLEEIQFTVLEGPCISAAETGEPMAVDDLRHELVPWPLFGAMACEKLPEVRSVYALPLFFGDYVLGSVDLLAMRPHALSAEALQQASHVADAVTAALMPTREMLLTGNKAPAWQPEEVIRAHWFDTWRAVGVLAARSRITPEDALALMRAEAFRTGRSLTDITRDILKNPPHTP